MKTPSRLDDIILRNQSTEPDHASPSKGQEADARARERAFRATMEEMKHVEKIRADVGLPQAEFGRIADAYARAHERATLQVQDELFREELARRTQRLPWVIRSRDHHGQDQKIRGGGFAQVTGGIQWASIRVEEIVIDENPHHWLVHDIKIGSRLQTLCSSGVPIPGDRFRAGDVMSRVRLDTCHSSMEFTLIVEYVGPDPLGEVFQATLVGTVVEQPT